MREPSAKNFPALDLITAEWSPAWWLRIALFWLNFPCNQSLNSQQQPIVKVKKGWSISDIEALIQEYVRQTWQMRLGEFITV